MFQNLDIPDSIADKFANIFGGLGKSITNNLGSPLHQMSNLSSKMVSAQSNPAESLKGSMMEEDIPSIRKDKLANALRGDKNKAESKSDILHKEKEEQKAQSKKIAQESFDRMAQILKGGRLGRTSKIFSLLGGKTAQDSGEFTSLSGALESMLVDQVSRGTLSNTRFEYITKTLLPKPTDSEAEIKGKMKGIAGLLGLDPSSLESPKRKSKEKYEFADEDLAEHEESYTDEPQDEKILDAEAMQDIVRLAKGNREKARQIAKKMGYKIE